MSKCFDQLQRQRPACERLEARRHLDAAPGEVTFTAERPDLARTYHLLAPTTWADAEAKSVALGGHLVVVDDQAEQDYLWSTFGPLTGIFWIGIHDTPREGRFVWTSGEPVDYTNWFPGEPNNLYPTGEQWGNMWVDYAGGWNDLGPDSEQGTTHFAVAEVRNGPDLFATLDAVPTSLQTGDIVELKGTLTNLGNATTSGAATAAYYLSADQTLDAGDRLIAGDVALPAGLPFNGSAPITAALGVPADVQPGTYYVLAKVDAGETVAESDESNNVAVSSPLDLGAVREPVFRTVRGVVRDGDDLPLHGVLVQSGDQTAHTDYDGRKSALDRDGVTGDFELPNLLVGHNVSFGAAFGRFEPADGTAADLVVTTGDLTGASYTNTLSIDELVTLAPTQPDGGLPPREPVTLGPIFLPDYKAAAPDGTIRLHRDLRNERNSDRISTKPNKALAASARYRKGVELVTARLSALGFREAGDAPLVTVAELKRNTPAERALKLFKDVTAGAPVTSGKSRAQATIDEAALATLNANPPAAGPLWTNALPEKWSVAPGVTDAYVSRATFEKMRQVAEASPADATFVLTRGSASTGGTGKSFRTGREIEFRWLATPGASEPARPFWEPIEGFGRTDVTLLGGKRLAVPDPGEFNVRWRYAAGYDQAATTAAIRSLLEAGATRVLFNDPTVLQELGAVAVVAGPKPVMTLLRDDLRPAAGYDSTIFAAL